MKNSKTKRAKSTDVGGETNGSYTNENSSESSDVEPLISNSKNKNLANSLR